MKKYQDFGIYDFSDYAEEIRSNPQAYAYYMAKQAEGFVSSTIDLSQPAKTFELDGK